MKGWAVTPPPTPIELLYYFAATCSFVVNVNKGKYWIVIKNNNNNNNNNNNGLLKIFQIIVWLFIHTLQSYNFRPQHPEEEFEEEAMVDDDAELTLNKVEEEMMVRPSS